MNDASTDEELVRSATRNRNICIILCVIVILGAFLFNIGKEKNHVSLTVLEDQLVFSAPGDSGYYVRVPLDQICAVDTASGIHFGELIEGLETRYFRYGTWENTAFGTYTLCAAADISTCLIITTADGSVFVTNYESNDTTVIFADALKKLLVDEGYWPESGE